jgi:hypothetical protein
MQVLTGEDPTPTDDVFSLACLFYRLVARYRVFGSGMRLRPPKMEWNDCGQRKLFSQITVIIKDDDT